MQCLCCCRKRAGADVITAPAKGSTAQSKLAAQLEARKKGTALATSRPTAAGGQGAQLQLCLCLWPVLCNSMHMMLVGSLLREVPRTTEK
jgi:hypothetical protein